MAATEVRLERKLPAVCGFVPRKVMDDCVVLNPFEECFRLDTGEFLFIRGIPLEGLVRLTLVSFSFPDISEVSLDNGAVDTSSLSIFPRLPWELDRD